MINTDPFTAARNTALTHARCRTLSPATQEYFQAIADGKPEPDDNFLPFWEALASCATRAGQSRERRTMVERLTALRTVVAEHGTVPAPPVNLRLTREALDLLSILLDTNDDDDELAENSGHTVATITDLRDAVQAARR